MVADLLSRLNPGVIEMLAGTPLETDLDKLAQLARVVPEEQAAVLRCHGLGVVWSLALQGRTLRDEQPEAPARSAHHIHKIERRRVSELKANRFNATLFPDSLSESSIAVMADDLAKNGQRVAVEITPDGTIVDGERRWRGATRLGLEDVEVLVGTDLTDDEILDRVLDSCTSSRRMTVREQVNVFSAVTEQLRREAGREQGRPSEKRMPNGIVFLTPADIRGTAAKRAAFSSTKQAVRAEAVFTRGSAEQQAAVLDGSLAVTAAYEALPKRSKRRTAGSTPDESCISVDGSGTREDRVELHPAPPAETADVPHASGPRAEDVRGDEEEGQPLGAGPTQLASEPVEGKQTPDIEEDPAAPVLVDETEEHDEQDVAVHVNAVCAHITRLAEHDYDEAAIWLGDLVEQMQASLGERSDFEDVDKLNAALDDFDALRDL